MPHHNGQALEGSIIPINAVKQNAFSHEVFDTQLLVSQGSAVTAQVYAFTQIHSIMNLQMQSRAQSLHLSAQPTDTKQARLKTVTSSCQGTWHVLAFSYL